MKFNAFIPAFLMVLALLAMPLSQASAQERIRQIRVEGTQRVEPSTVLSYMNFSVGDYASSEDLDRVLKNLFATGLFADVAIKQERDVLFVKVAENPIINQIAFEGNKRLDDEELLPEIQLRPRQVFTRTKVQSDVSRLYQVYRRNGRFSVNVDPKVIKLDQNRVNLVFEITEGDLTKVESIRFVGNEKYDDDRLRSEISTKESVWYRFITADDRYDPDRLAYDQELLRKFYLSQGYADFRILSAIAELSSNREDFYVTFTIEEGSRYKLGDVDINSHIRNFDATVLGQYLQLEKGDWYNADEVQETVDTLTDALGDRQYAFVNIRPNVKRNREERRIDITFQINETPRVFVERININGNVRTLDKVVRREIELVESDPFNRSKLARSERNIRNLDYFETTELNVSPGSAPDKTVLDVEVSEKSTGELSLGAGFSTTDGPLADVRLSERNFLGRGQKLSVGATMAGERSEIDLSFTEPYFLNRDVSAGFDLFHITRDLQDESSFDQRRTGGAVRLGYPLSKNWRQTLRYRYERNDITDVQLNASRFIREQEGQRDTSAVSQRVTYDNRDSIIFPTTGWYLWFDTEFAGVGGDAKYVSSRTGASYYYSVWDEVVLNVLGEGGAIEGYDNTDVAINERFYLGGNTLRGFEQAGVGPRDISTDDALGGKYFYRGSVEASFPLGLPEELGIKGHTFSDFGSLFELDETDSNVRDEKSLRASVGVGLSWRSPFGPIRMDFSTPIVDEEYDETEVFRFDFGTRF